MERYGTLVGPSAACCGSYPRPRKVLDKEDVLRGQLEVPCLEVGNNSGFLVRPTRPRFDDDLITIQLYTIQNQEAEAMPT